MNFRDAVSTAKTEANALLTESSPKARNDVLGNESLFHTPLIALTIILLARSRVKPKQDEIGMLVGVCFEKSLAGFKGSSQELGWSANLRIRTVKALTFLEDTGLIITDKSTSRIAATESGKKLIDSILKEDSRLCIALLMIKRSYRNICKERAVEAKLNEI
ncbi:hypothetical protein A988_01501 [Pseudomonas syringae BRIP39023]|jgi:hypothetical protein|uniref:hypothetical protein n=1 Tax=Pseudomonas syringae TaxID=317 RepID=UPI0002A78E08|nr:hypothetical protein [Pseudomonas syringae]ELQ14734.1 hypothetical protein A988_01501 [Pseudomonas syringae BRIP39023]